jgi:hypothetical protein
MSGDMAYTKKTKTIPNRDVFLGLIVYRAPPPKILRDRAGDSMARVEEKIGSTPPPQNPPSSVALATRSIAT